MRTLTRILISILALLLSASAYGQWITGYYSDQNGIESISQIPWNKYTHIIHFAAAPGTTSGTGDGSVELHYLTQPNINALVAARPSGKKAIVCIKDNDSYTSAFSQSTAPALLAKFVTNIATFVNGNGYDGVDIDWEDNVNVSQYNSLLSALRTALPNKIITIAAGDWNSLQSVANTSQSHLDQINIECYDMDTEPGGRACSGSDCSWFNSAILQVSDVHKRTCDHRIGVFTSAGVAAAKIGVGIPFYERENQGVDQPQVLGDFTQVTLHYRDLVSNSTLWQRSYMQVDTVHDGWYLSIPSLNYFITYIGNAAINAYVGWMKSKSFGGFMTFSIEDEFNPSANGDDQYPLSSTLFNILFGGSTRGGNAHYSGNRSSH